MKKVASIILVIFVFMSCDLHKIHQPLHTYSLEESKNKGAYEFSYQPKFVFINDSISFNIKEAWCEKIFYYDEFDDKGRIINNWNRNIYQAIFIADVDLEKKYKGFGDNWWIIRTVNYKTCYDAVISNIISKKLPDLDSVEIKFEYATRFKDKESIIKPLGSFYLVKKKFQKSSTSVKKDEKIGREQE